jgi:large subunit ribosomal protein L3
MPHFVLGRKLGMTQMWGPEGNRISATVVQVGPCTVTAKKTKETRDGYNAIQVAFEEVPERKLTKPELGVFTKLGLAPHRHLREFRVNDAELGKYEVGDTYSTEHIQMGNFVDATGTSMGRGFSESTAL